MRLLIDSECREDGRQDGSKLVEAFGADGTPFSELLVLNSHFEAFGVYF